MGERGWRVPRIEVGIGATRSSTVLPLTEAPRVQLPPAVADAMTVRTHFNVPAELAGRTVRVEVDGALPVTGCGSFEPQLKSEPLPDLIVTVGDEALPISGAVCQRDAATRRHKVTLSTSPLDCDADATEAEVVIDLTLDRIGRSVEAAVIRGLRVGNTEAASLARGDVRSKLRGLGRSVGLELDGQTEIGGIPFAFEGQAQVAFCR